MSEEAVSARDVENLVMSFDFISIPLKRTLITTLKREVANVNEIKREENLRKIYNIYAIVGQFHCEALFTNGRITFKEDNALIFETIAGAHINSTELMLFSGCSLAKDKDSTYILLNNIETPDSVKKICNNFDFNKLIQDAITPPEVSVVMNIGYYPSQIENILQLIK